MNTIRGLVTLAALACAVSCAGPAAPRAALAPAELAPLFTRTSGWTHGDGAATVALSGGRVAWLFSDSIITEPGAGRRMVNNAVAAHSLSAPSGAEFAWGWGGPPAAPALGAFFPSQREGHWNWLAGGGAESDGRLTIFLWSMSRRGVPGVWDFMLRGTGAATITNPEASPDRWTWTHTPLFDETGGKPGAKRQWGSAVAMDGTHAYIYGVDTTGGHNKRLILARSPAASLAQASAWEFLTERGDWSTASAEAAPVLGDASRAADEFSVHHLREGDRDVWLLIQMEASLGRRIMARTAPRPEGPWSAPSSFFTCPEPASDTRLFVYSAKAHPELSREGELLITYCVNSSSFEHAWNDPAVYRPRVISVALGEIPGLNPSLKPPADSGR